jgi:hypothetical protein
MISTSLENKTLYHINFFGKQNIIYQLLWKTKHYISTSLENKTLYHINSLCGPCLHLLPPTKVPSPLPVRCILQEFSDALFHICYLSTRRNSNSSLNKRTSEIIAMYKINASEIFLLWRSTVQRVYLPM